MESMRQAEQSDWDIGAEQLTDLASSVTNFLSHTGIFVPGADAAGQQSPPALQDVVMTGRLCPPGRDGTVELAPILTRVPCCAAYSLAVRSSNQYLSARGERGAAPTARTRHM